MLVDLGLRIPISAKLVAMTAALILAAAIPIAFRSSELFESTFGKSQNDANAELANSKATEVESLIFNYVERVRAVSGLLLQEFSDSEQRQHALDLVFFRDLDLINVEIYQLQNGQPALLKGEVSERHLKSFDLNKDYIARLQRERPFPLLSSFSDKDRIVIQNRSLAGGIPLFTMGVPFPDENGVVRQVAVADIRLDRLQKAFSVAGARTLYLVDQRGVLLAHTNDKLAVAGMDYSEMPLVADALARSANSNRGQKRFNDLETGEWFVGAYSKTPFGITVIAQAPENIILEPAKLVRQEAFTVAGYVLSAALFFVILFSITLTIPIEKLHEATELVAQGNFNVKAIVRTHDEVGELAESFNTMVDGLKERDKVKNLFNKFHGSTVTDDLLKNDVNLGGKRRDVTVFFSDIRDFTKFSEGHTPEEVVDMLNEYFQIMVGIVTANHGIVDKFVGDAMMAIWGAPRSTGHDQLHAVKASLEMRIALAQLNASRLQRGQTAIKIGMGLHSGPAISGTIGSTERMEYTVIGDTVNMASRIESSTKAFGADLLISQAVAEQIKDSFVLELAGSAEVKGKAEPIKMFKVRGYVGEDGKPVPVQTPYSDYEAGHADKVKVS